MLLSSRLRMTLGDTGSRDSMAWPYALVVGFFRTCRCCHLRHSQQGSAAVWYCSCRLA